MKAKKVLSALLAATLMATTLAGCSGGGVSSPAPAAPSSLPASVPPSSSTAPEAAAFDLGGREIKVVTWYEFFTNENADIDSDIALFEKKQAIEAKYNCKFVEVNIPSEDIGQQFLAKAMAGEQLGDIVFCEMPVAVNLFKEGLLFPIGDVVDYGSKNYYFDQNYVGAALTDADGKAYGYKVSEGPGMSYLYFNKRLVEDAGVDVQSLYDLALSDQWTWDKFVQIAAQCTKNAGSPDAVYGTFVGAANQGIIQTLLSIHDAPPIGYQDGKFVSNVQNPNFAKALQTASDLVNVDKIALTQPADAAWDFPMAAFREGKYAFSFAAEWQMMNFKKNMADPFGILPVPTLDGKWKNGEFAMPDVAVMPKNMDPELARQIAIIMDEYMHPEKDDIKSINEARVNTLNFFIPDEQSLKVVQRQYEIVSPIIENTYIGLVMHGDEVEANLNQPIATVVSGEGTTAQVIAQIAPVFDTAVAKLNE